MAYPEEIPTLKGKDAEEFITRFDSFELSTTQRKFLQGAKELYKKLRPGD